MCVVDAQLLDSAPGLQVRDKVAAKVFSPSIRVENLNPDPHVIFHPGLVTLVRIGLLVLRPEEVYVSEASLIVDVSVHVIFSAFGLD